MKALRKTKAGKGHVKIQEVNIPEIKDNEVLMKVWAGGICGSDLLIEDDKHFYEAPVTLGHEYSGVVEKVGADYTLYSEENPAEQIREITDGKGADFVLECSASQKGVQHAIDCARRSPEGRGGRGKISFISLWNEPITIEADAISLYQLTIKGSWSWNGRETWERAMDLISREVFDLDSLLTNRYQLEEWKTAFTNLRQNQDVKVFFHPNGTDWI